MAEDTLKFPDFLKRDRDPNKPLPSWVQTKGQADAPREWAKPKPYVPAVKIKAPTIEDELVAAGFTLKVKPASVAREPKREKGEQGVGRAGTAAEQVRGMIREAMATGKDIAFVIQRVKTELSFGDAKANRYVTENWARIEKAKGK